MFIIRNLCLALGHVLNIVINLYILIMVANAICSWVNADIYNPLVSTISTLAHYVTDPIRRRVNLTIGMIDLTPMAVIIGLIFIKDFVVKTLLEIARKL